MNVFRWLGILSRRLRLFDSTKLNEYTKLIQTRVDKISATSTTTAIVLEDYCYLTSNYTRQKIRSAND